MSNRKKLLVKLIVFLIQFIGKDVDGFYGYSFEEMINEYLKEEKQDEKRK